MAMEHAKYIGDVNMTNDHGNTLLKHCGEPEIPDAIKPLVPEVSPEYHCPRCAEMEEHNIALAKRLAYSEAENRSLREKAAGRCFE